MSTLAKALDDQSGLMQWQSAMVALGVVRERALMARLAAMLSADGYDAYAKNRADLRDITKRALAAAGADRASDNGTAWHIFTEVVDEGQWPEFIPPEAEGPLQAYAETMRRAGVKVLGKEVFVAVDEVRSAGSMDRLLSLDGDVMGADIKSGRNNSRYPLAVTCQTAIYSHGERYNVADDTRAPLWPDGVNQETALLIEIPREPNRFGKYECGLYKLPIDLGWRAVQLAMDVREMRKMPKLERIA
ncbi:hypothetical protein [Nocardia transvalensis]|uniref:hypothetical protein n=1 Tax=Nocardia transvalensis TaxID=37333 RepID=UPI0018945EA4|nr:hypothetical protein [Nocardia transvalensis]MBF6333422.1 hypothetical protein [Nocardia transvalensis]